MSTRTIRTLAFAAAVALAAAAATAQTETSSSQAVNLTGSYTLESVNLGQTEVRMQFDATVTNTGANDVAGPIMLRHPNDIHKVYHRFGDQSIGAGKSVKLSANVSVPRRVYDGWASRGPALYFYTKNERGDIKTYRIGLTAAAPIPAPSK